MGKTPVWAWENTRAPKAHFYLFFSIAGCPGKARAFCHFVFFYNSVGDSTRETTINISYVCICIHRNWKLAVARHWVMSNVLQFYFHSSFFKTCFSHFHFLYIYILQLQLILLDLSLVILFMNPSTNIEGLLLILKPGRLMRPSPTLLVLGQSYLSHAIQIYNLPLHVVRREVVIRTCARCENLEMRKLLSISWCFQQNTGIPMRLRWPWVSWRPRKWCRKWRRKQFLKTFLARLTCFRKRCPSPTLTAMATTKLPIH